MSKFSIVHVLILAGLIVAASVALNVTTPSAAMACSDPPCRAK
jgi:hypothetical protein